MTPGGSQRSLVCETDYALDYEGTWLEPTKARIQSYMLLNASLEGSDQVFLNLSADGHYAIVGTYTYWHV